MEMTLAKYSRERRKIWLAHGGVDLYNRLTDETTDERSFTDPLLFLLDPSKRSLHQLLTIIITITQWRLNNKSAKVRMQASDLIGRIAVVMKTCGEEVLMSHLGVVLYEYLGEEYPEVLGSILGALKVGCGHHDIYIY